MSAEGGRSVRQGLPVQCCEDPAVEAAVIEVDGDLYDEIAVDLQDRAKGRLCRRQLLRDTSLPIADIASSVDCADASAFTHAFKRCSGVSPGAWRRYPPLR